MCYDLVHTDLAGSFTVQSIGGSLYYMTIIDDTSQYAHVYFLKQKSDACKHPKEYSKLVHNKTGCYSRIVRSDRTDEYVNTEWNNYCSSKGIEHQITPAYSPQSNTVVERFNLTITNMSRSALLFTCTQNNAPPKFLWTEVFNWAVYLRNQLPHSTLQRKTPYEVLYNKRPSIGHLRPFYTKYYVTIPEALWGPGSKLEQYVSEGHLTGFIGKLLVRVYIPSKKRVDVFRIRNVGFVPADYGSSTSIEIDTPASTSNSTPVDQSPD